MVIIHQCPLILILRKKNRLGKKKEFPMFPILGFFCSINVKIIVAFSSHFQANPSR